MDEIRTALEEVRGSCKLYKIEVTGSGTASAATYCHYKSAVKSQARLVRNAKQDWVLQFAGQIKPEDVWKLTSWYEGIRWHHSPPLRCPDRTKAVSPAEKCSILCGSFFPPPPILPNITDTDLSSPNESTRDFLDITHDEVDSALSPTLNNSAPGVSGINYQALKWAWILRPTELLWILCWSLQLGVHHDWWKTAITVVIPKPNKPSYSEPRAYHPIQLLECLGKLLKKIIASRIAYDIGKYCLVPFE